MSAKEEMAQSLYLTFERASGVERIASWEVLPSLTRRGWEEVASLCFPIPEEIKPSEAGQFYYGPANPLGKKSQSAPEQASANASAPAIDPAAAIRLDRNQKYGHFYASHENAGRIWAGMISHHLGRRIPDLPPYLVALMMSAHKILRASHEGGADHDDNYIDAKVYVDIARDCIEWEKKSDPEA